MGNIQGTYKFMSLLTGLLIKSRSFVMLPMPSEVIKQVAIYADGQSADIVFSDRTGSNSIGDLTTEEEGDPNNDHQDGYGSEEESSDDEVDESLIFDDEIGEGDREVTDAVGNILPELPGTMGLPDRQLGRIQGVGMDRDGQDGHGGEISDSENESEEGSEKDVLENNGVTEHGLENISESLVSNDKESVQEVNQSIIDIANTFEAQLDDPGLDTLPVSPIVETVEDPPQDPVPNFINRFGREIRPRRFLMHEGFGALAMGEGDPELWRPSAQSSYGMHQQQEKDRCFFHKMAVHFCMTQMSLKVGLREWKGDAKEAVKKEMCQMHDKHVFAPKKASDMTRQEKLEALRSVIFLKKKRCGRIKGWLCADGRPQRKLYQKNDAASPTVKTESVMLTAVQEADEGRDVAVVDIPGAFLNAYLEEVVYMRLEGVVADTLIMIAPEVYGPMANKNSAGVTVLYVQLTRALYGCLKSSLRWYLQLSRVLQD